MVTLHGWTGIRLRFILIRCGGIVYRISRTLLMQKLTLILWAVLFYLPDLVLFLLTLLDWIFGSIAKGYGFVALFAVSQSGSQSGKCESTTRLQRACLFHDAFPLSLRALENLPVLLFWIADPLSRWKSKANRQLDSPSNTATARSLLD